MMNRKMWVRIGFVAIAVVILVAVYLSILTAFPPNVQHQQEPIKRVNWIHAGAPGLRCHYPPSESAVIVYDGENDTWLLQDAVAWNRAIDLGADYSTEPARPEEIWYNRDIAIEGGAIGLDFFVRNFAGEDCAHADFVLTTEVGHLNATTGSMAGDIITDGPSVVPVDDLANGEWREVRAVADLPRPNPEEILLFSITLTAPDTLTTQNGTTLTYNPNFVTVIENGYISRVEESVCDPLYAGACLPRGNSATFIVQGTDVLEIGPQPTLSGSGVIPA